MLPLPSVVRGYLDASSNAKIDLRTSQTPAPCLGTFRVSAVPELQMVNPDLDPSVPPSADPVAIQDEDDRIIQMSIDHWEVPPTPLPNELQPHPFAHSVNEWEPRGVPADIPAAMPGPYRERVLQSLSHRVTKRQGKPRGGRSRKRSEENFVGEHENYMGEEVPPSLKSNCPEVERCIFASRWRHRHQGDQDMWENIQTDFQNQFHKNPSKEMLQMKLRHGQSKYIEWLDEDVCATPIWSSSRPMLILTQEELLREAWTIVERSRYQLILDAFIDLGGSRNMRLCASDIEAKVANDLKLEEGLYVEYAGKANKRRRCKY
ncbi:hypothetical protein FGADI_12588 [Fusarium gaditjirri]|uniref:Uncharacterized protein n=1 Tax=Fusarium gaditjirri TaxID=282569 RepID=A0A8H4WP02_9HYPO|nr:hypothetical protein FGADI_12588 [Fusarium gaditjirri]